MPLTPKGRKIKAAMTAQYGEKKGTRVFHASQNKGTITGTHRGGRKVAGKMHYGNPEPKPASGKGRYATGRTGGSNRKGIKGAIRRGSEEAIQEFAGEASKRHNPY